MDNKISNPHDVFFKVSFGDIEVAKDFFVNYLPDDLKDIINYEKITLENDTYIDQELSQYYSDILYKTELEGKEAYLYFLFEHKSYNDKWSVLQLLNYMVKIWMKVKKESNPDELPLVIPILFYHGKSNSNIKKSIEDYFKCNHSLKRFIPLFEILFFDFSLKSNTEILGSFKLQYALKIIKMIKNKKINVLFKKISHCIIQLKDNDQEYLFQGIKYIFEMKPEEFDMKELEKLLKEEGLEEVHTRYM